MRKKKFDFLLGYYIKWLRIARTKIGTNTSSNKKKEAY